MTRGPADCELVLNCDGLAGGRWNQNPRIPPSNFLDIAPTRRIYTATTERRRLGATALRLSFKSTSVASGPAGREAFDGPFFGVCRGEGGLSALLFEIVERKKEKRRRRSPCGLPVSRARARGWEVLRDFGGTTFRSSQSNRASDCLCLGLVKRSDQNKADDQNLVQLESLILAQSERWRQA
jgi:hypothetical protein